MGGGVLGAMEGEQQLGIGRLDQRSQLLLLPVLRVFDELKRLFARIHSWQVLVQIQVALRGSVQGPARQVNAQRLIFDGTRRHRASLVADSRVAVEGGVEKGHRDVDPGGSDALDIFHPLRKFQGLQQAPQRIGRIARRGEDQSLDRQGTAQLRLCTVLLGQHHRQRDRFDRVEDALSVEVVLPGGVDQQRDPARG